MFVAHSARPEKNIPQQAYSEHIIESCRRVLLNTDQVAPFTQQYRLLLKQVTMFATEFHDLGKLDEQNQLVLSGIKTGRKLPVQHTDAGVAHLLELPSTQARQLAAVLAYAHHIGLPAFAEEQAKGSNCFRDENSCGLIQHTNTHLSQYLRNHNQALHKTDELTANLPGVGFSSPSLFLRIALGCLADADHGDTARHYGEPESSPVALKAAQRLKKLTDHVEKLGQGKVDQRNLNRAAVFKECLNSDTTQYIYACDSPVGSGKTFSVMAHLLKAAVNKNLRRVIVVLPFTSIINQAVTEYRKALVLDGEDENEVVVAHHHRADFSSPTSRQLTVLWQAPIIVTTAVQFFETLASNRPAALRKLHRLPGSGVFIDEAHAALPAPLLPQAWSWLQQLAKDWSCHFVLASGSLTRFWELEEFSNPVMQLPNLVPNETRESLAQHEVNRVIYRKYDSTFHSAGELVDWLQMLPGPRLLIVNTIQSAAVVAGVICERHGKEKVEHLSTALTPTNRERTLTQIKQRLASTSSDWTLVATSLVEAGVDFSFKTGIREAAALVNLIQIGGRINRHHEYTDPNTNIGSDVWTIFLAADQPLKTHKGFETSAHILEQMFAENKIAPDFCKEAMRREIRTLEISDVISNNERVLNFPAVTKNFRVIDSGTYTVVVDQKLICDIESGKHISNREIQDGSVQIWGYKFTELGVTEFSNYPQLYRWNLAYDSFVGYMKGVLVVEKLKMSGGGIV